MRYAKTLLVLLTAIMLFSCRKDDDYYWGTITVQKNGVDWPSKIRSTQSTISSSKINININTIDQDGIVVEQLNFFKIPKAVGFYPLSYTFDQPPNDSLIGCIYANGYDDQLFDSYLLSPLDSTSFLEITEYDSKKKEVKGRFNLIVWPDIKGSWNAPDSIVFSNGEFHTRVVD